MKTKLIFIIFLLALLVFTVYKMMQYENFIRGERNVKLYIEDKSKPLIVKFSDEELREAAFQSDYYFTATGNYFNRLVVRYIEDEKRMMWEDLFLKGVNLGVAVPGKFPAEFSLNFDQYLEWMQLIGEMNANVIRTYTILPPEFYDALLFYNLRHSESPLYIMQGVWAEVPADENYYNPDFKRDFQKEIVSAIDVIHGNTVLKEHPGKAAGVYSSDVSRYVVSLLLGREWEPGSVFRTNRNNPNRQYHGDFISMNDGNAMEAWLAEMMDFAVLYETQGYHFQHPVSFVNWLPLDPMYHSTEIIENKKVREYDNDLESIDFMKFHATDLFYPGIFAAYHAYPYYPDFIYLQESYHPVDTGSAAANSYLGYLGDLKRHCPGMPLVIAEYGLPSSRGNSHFSPFGYHQGGHSEAEQAGLSLLLTRDIVDSKCAGAIYFEWIDEWFKHNWLVMDFEQPADDRKLWHNMENPEQNFGICAMESRTKAIDGIPDDWEIKNPDPGKTSLFAEADAAYFYLASNLPGFDFSRNNLYIAIDTYDSEKGDHRLPFTDKEFDNGFEFLLEFKSTDSALILVDEPYSVFTDIYNDFLPVYASQYNANGRFIHQLMLTNRGRVSLTGQKTDSMLFDRSPLLFGNSSLPQFSNSNWCYNEHPGFMEIRLDWHLLNVSDPARRYVLDDLPGTSEIEYTKTDGFKIYLFVTDKQDVLINQYPGDLPATFTWQEWEVPEYTARLKPIYYTLQDYFKDLSNFMPEEDSPEVQDESFRITEFFNNAPGAISISFDNAGFSQVQIASPVLEKYGLRATFGIIPEMADDVPRLYELDDNLLVKRLSIKEVRELARKNEIAYQPFAGHEPGRAGLSDLVRRAGTHVYSMHWYASSVTKPKPDLFHFIRTRSNEPIFRTAFDGISYTIVDPGLGLQELDELIKSGRDKWLILIYHHLFENPAEIPHQANVNDARRFFIARDDFEKQVRLLRNSGYWVTTEARVHKYLKERKGSEVRTERYKNMIFLRIVNLLDAEIFDQPLTVEFNTGARTIRIEGSVADGIYTNRTGSIFFNAMPNKEITIEIIE